MIAKTELPALTIYADAPLDSLGRSVKQVKKKINTNPHYEPLIKRFDFLDLCDLSPCQNGGTCQAGLCKCTDAFTGAKCETGNRDFSSKHIKNFIHISFQLQISVIQTPARMVEHA